MPRYRVSMRALRVQIVGWRGEPEIGEQSFTEEVEAPDPKRAEAIGRQVGRGQFPQAGSVVVTSVVEVNEQPAR